MITSDQTIRLIFGLKMRQLRQEKGLSFAALSQTSGLSVSYLNEIEKGKKYPKADKILALSQALEVEYDQLVSIQLDKKLAPISDLLNSEFLNNIPLTMFGLEINKLIEMIAKAPVKVNAFISTLIKLARSYEMQSDDFFFSALRSYQEMHDNYFPELEAAAKQFAKKYKIDVRPPVLPDQLIHALKEVYGYTIDEQALSQRPLLQGFRAIYNPEKNKLIINDSLSSNQKAFLLGKEIAFNYLGLQERPILSNSFTVKSFDEVLNHFKASYFSVALLMNEQMVVADMKALFGQKQWDSERFMDIMYKYAASPEMFIQRLTNLLPKRFGIKQLFFLRFNNQTDSHRFHITKELHLSRLHDPHKNELSEHYCRRWVSIRVLNELKAAQKTRLGRKHVMKTQRSRYIENGNEYICFAIGRSNSPTPNTNVSVTLGLVLDKRLKKKLRFWNDDKIVRKEVNETCERCTLAKCAERVAPPSVYEAQRTQEKIETALAELMQE